MHVNKRMHFIMSHILIKVCEQKTAFMLKNVNCPLKNIINLVSEEKKLIDKCLNDSSSVVRNFIH